jgi:hypothetical protein
LIERKDIRAKLDDDMHSALKAICEVDKIDVGVFIEQVLLPVIQKRVHDAILLAELLPGPGISGNSRESRATPGRRSK